MALKSMGYHRTARGKKYDLQFDPTRHLAQAVMLPKGVGAGQVVLAFRVSSEEEAFSMLVKALDGGFYF